MATLDTVKIKSADTEFGYVIINADEFDASVHKLYTDAPKAKTAGGASTAETGPTKADLLKLTKSELVAKAGEVGVEIASPDDVTKEKIADLILEQGK